MATIENNIKRKRVKSKRIHWLHKYKCAKGCEKCGWNKHGVGLEFDHINPMDKNHFTVGQGKGGAGMNGLVKRICTKNKELNRQRIRDIFTEIRKCRLLCACCHRIESYEARQHESNFEVFSYRRGEKEIKDEESTLMVFLK